MGSRAQYAVQRATHLLESTVGVSLSENVGKARKGDVDSRGDRAVLDLLGVTDVDDGHVLGVSSRYPHTSSSQYLRRGMLRNAAMV